MSLDALKSEALKLEKSDLFDFAQFIIEALKQKDNDSGFQLSEAQEKEIAERIAEFKKNPSSAISGLEAEKKLIEKYGLKL